MRDDEDAETISLVAVENSADRQSRDVADRMAAFICAAAGPITTNALREAMKGAAGREVQNTAMNQLRGEGPEPRAYAPDSARSTPRTAASQPKHGGPPRPIRRGSYEGAARCGGGAAAAPPGKSARCGGVCVTLTHPPHLHPLE